MQVKATTPTEYIAELPHERQAAIKKLRQVIKKNLPKGFQECMSYGMLAFAVPHSLYPAGYHCAPEQPLPFISLASQKHHISLYHMGLYDGPLLEWFKNEWPKHSEAKLDMGKCCVRFKKVEQIPYALIAELARKMTAQEWIAAYAAARR